MVGLPAGLRRVRDDPLIAVALAGAVLALRQQWRLALVLLAWVFVPFTVAMLFSTAPFPRHVMYVLPPAIVLAAFALVEGARLAGRLMPARWAAVVCVVVGLLLLAPALRLDLRILHHPATARYPGLDDLQYVRGPAGHRLAAHGRRDPAARQGRQGPHPEPDGIYPGARDAARAGSPLRGRGRALAWLVARSSRSPTRSPSSTQRPTR